MGYTLATLNELSNLNNEIHVVCWDTKKLTPYQHLNSSNIIFYNRSEFNHNQLLLLANKLEPSIIVISGWVDKDYLKVGKVYKSKGIPVITGLDSQWKGTLRQHIAKFLSCLLKKYFSHVWVSGYMQYEYARKLGFKGEQIIYNLYSADLKLFNQSYFNFKEIKSKNMPHKFLYVGRFETVKSLDLLLSVWEKLKDNRKDWELHLIGNGSLNLSRKYTEGVFFSDFLQPVELSSKIKDAGCFILPSTYEPWGVVIQEFAAAGLPIVCSNRCGAATEFVINGYNGYIFMAGQRNSLYDTMIKIIELDDKSLNDFSDKSHTLAQRITPLSSASNLLSILK